jgi:peptide/nickel transport system substrate-binding protein
VAAMLAKVGIIAKIENVEWAQWLSGPFKGNFDLTIVNHVEPLDYMQYTNKAYYWGYDSPVFDKLVEQHASTTNAAERLKLWQQMQRQLATDAVNDWIFNPTQVAVGKKGLKGLWASSPIFANDIAAVRWER